jgi:hypothetical protein
MNKLFTLFLLCLSLCVYGQDTLNTMFYNLYRFPVMPPVHREYILRDILNSYHPDLFMTAELVNEDGANRILNTSLNSMQPVYLRAAFIATQSDTTDPLQQMVFYNKQKLILLKQQTYPTKVRDINQYTFLLNTEDASSDSVFLEVFVAHLKSSEGPGNRQFRLGMVDTFVKHMENIPSSHYVLFAGDFNFYSAYNEPAYQKIINPGNPIVMVDPIHAPGKWNDNDSFKAIHTQATRISADGFGTGGASGGMDDRFDFIMMSKSLEQIGALQYINGSYKAYGNNGNCFNNRIDAYDCDGPYSLLLRQNLYNMSDHIPVVMQLKTNKRFTGIAAISTPKALTLLNGNIVSDFLYLKMNEALPYRANDFMLFNNLGQKLNVQQESHGKEIVFDLRHLKAGVYYLKYVGKEAQQFKIIKK